MAESPLTHLWSTPPTRAFQNAMSSTPWRCETLQGCGLRKACARSQRCCSSFLLQVGHLLDEPRLWRPSANHLSQQIRPHQEPHWPHLVGTARTLSLMRCRSAMTGISASSCNPRTNDGCHPRRGNFISLPFTAMSYLPKYCKPRIPDVWDIGHSSFSWWYLFKCEQSKCISADGWFLTQIWLSITNSANGDTPSIRDNLRKINQCHILSCFILEVLPGRSLWGYKNHLPWFLPW